MPKTKEEEKLALIDGFKIIIIDKLFQNEVLNKDAKRNSTFGNGFIAGYLSCTHLLMECFAETADIAEVETGMEGLHRASHLLFGEAKDTNGKCSFIEEYNKEIINTIINRMVGHAKAKGVKEEIQPYTPLTSPTSGKPN